MVNRSIRLLLFFIFSFNGISIAQISVFSNTKKADCDNWNSNNSWTTALKRPVTVSGLPVGGLTASGIQLREVRVRLGNSACKGNLSSYQLRLSNPQGVQITLASGLSSSTSDMWVDMKFRDDIALEQLREYNVTAQSSYVPHSIGYYAIRNDGDFNQFLTSDNPNGDWLFEVIEATTSEVSFEKVELVFGPSLNVRDVTSCFTNNTCAGASCIYNGVFRGNNAPPDYPEGDAQYPGNTVNGCSWNGANNNSAWFSFKPTSTTARVTISGMLNRTNPGDNDMQPIILKANGNCQTPTIVPKGGCPNDQTVNNRAYSSDVAINPAPNTGGSTTGNIYSNGISANCEFNLSGLVLGDTYYLYVDGNGGQSSFFYIEVESGFAAPCDFCCIPITISGPTSVCSGASAVKYTQTGGATNGTWSVNPASAGTIDASGNFTPATGVTSDIVAEIVFTDADCVRRYDVIVTKCTTFGHFATAAWLTTCNTNSFYNTSGTGEDLIDREFKDFNGRFLGTFVQNSNSLKLRGGEVKTFKNLTLSNVCGAKMYYRVFAQGSTPGTFTSLNLPFFQNCDVPNSKFPSGGPCKDGDQKWQEVLNDAEGPVNLTAFPPGNYVLQVYYDVSGDANSTTGCDPNDLLTIDNAGRYFSANFTIQSTPVYSSTNPTTCNGTDGTISISGLAPSTIYSLSYTDGTTAVGPSNFTSDASGKINITGLNAGSYAGFSLTVDGCVLNNSSSITLVDPAVPSVTVNSPTVCSGNAPTITATPGTPGTYSYAWTTPSGVTNPGNVASFSTSTPGNYNVVITNTATNCISSSASGTVTINSKPTVTVNSPAVCSGQSASVVATPGVAGNYNYTWTVPSGVNNPGNVASFTTTTAGAYGVVITNPTTNCASESASGTVTINLLPTVSVNSPAVCSGQTATVTATPGTPGTYSYAWTVPSGATGPGNVASFTTNTPGIYSVVISNTSTNCSSSSSSGTVIINPNPTVSVNSLTICAGLTATITASPGAPATYNYSWTVPAGVTNPGNVASFSATTAGTYSVVITNTATNCLSTSASGTLTLSTNITPSFSPIGPLCLNAPAPTLPLKSNNGIDGSWQPTTINTSVSGTQTYTFTPAAGQCTSAAAPLQVVINPLPTVTVNSPAVCTGQTATITATPGTLGTYSYAWTIPSGATNPGSVATFPTTTSGVYSVIITNTATNCVSSSASGTVTINANPTVTVNSPAICSGATATLTATPGAPGSYSYAWTVPNGVTNPGNVASFSSTTAGAYSVIITNTTTNCSSTSASGNITVNALPTVTVNSPAVCQGNQATLTATPGTTGTYSYAWTTPAGVTIPGNVATFSSGTAGNYTVIITNTTTNCSSTSASGSVTVNPLPTVTVNSPTICEGTPATITATPGTPGTYSYVWTVPAGAANPGNSSSFSSAVAGSYVVVITNTATNCTSASASGTLTATQKTVPTFTQLGPFCKDATISAVLPLQSNNNISGSWQPSVISTASAETSTYTFKPNAGQCAADATMDITIKTLSFSVDAGEPITIGAGASAQANAALSGITITDVASILWTPSTGLSADNIIDPLITPSIPNGTLTYSISVKDNAGCVATDDLIVNVLGECLDIKTAFTPNGDGLNERWIVFKNFFCLKNISVTVFNRYGSVVYRNSNYQNQWDGTFKGKPCPDGTYYAVLEIELATGRKYIQRTDVTIVR